MGSYDSLNLDNCETLYAQGTGAVTAPYFAYNHGEKVVPGETCTTGSSSISGLAFYTGDAFPAAYKNALFFSDYSRNCIWVMLPGRQRPAGPGDAADLRGRRGRPGVPHPRPGRRALLRRPRGRHACAAIAADNNAPTARIAATPSSGVAPLTVAFDGTTSTRPRGPGAHLRLGPRRRRRLRRLDRRHALAHVREPRARSPSACGSPTRPARRARRRRRSPSARRPTVTITSPTSATTWAVGDTISFSGSARDSAGATLPASALRWALDMRHCSRSDATNCHTHHMQDYVGVASGSFVAPDHEYPSHLELSLTATDAAGPDRDADRPAEPADGGRRARVSDPPACSSRSAARRWRRRSRAR